MYTVHVVQEFCDQWRLKSNTIRRYFLKRLVQVLVHGSGGIHVHYVQQSFRPELVKPQLARSDHLLSEEHFEAYLITYPLIGSCSGL